MKVLQSTRQTKEADPRLNEHSVACATSPRNSARESETPEGLVRMSSVQLYKSRTFVLIWHLIAISQYYYAIYFDRYFVKIPNDLAIPKMMRPGEFGGRTKFLTYWCLVSTRISRPWEYLGSEAFQKEHHA